MRRSPELEAVVRKLVSTSDTGEYRDLLIESPDLVTIGTDEREWHHGWDEVDGVAEIQGREALTQPVRLLRLHAYQSGQVGWAVGAAAMKSPEGGSRLLRFSWVLLLEDEKWRIIHVHQSLGVPNEELYGYELTTSLSDLVSSLQGDHRDIVARTAPAGTATLMFTDIEDSTKLSESMGDAAWSAFVRSHFEALREIVEAEGGTVVKTLGDGGMFVFGSVRAGLTVAIKIQRTVSAATDVPIAVRIGVHTGEVQHAEGDYLGLTVNKAARIAAATAGGDITVSTVTAELAGEDGYEFGEPKTVELKGLRGTHRIVPLIWA